MLLGEARSQTLTGDLPQAAAPNPLAETGQLPPTATTQILGERMLAPFTPPAIEAAPKEAFSSSKPEPHAEEPGYRHPLMTPQTTSLTPQERLDAATNYYGAGDDTQASAQNRFDAQRRRTQRVKDGLDPYSVVRAITGGYLRGFRR